MCQFLKNSLCITGSETVLFGWPPSYDIALAKFIIQLHNLAILQLHYVTLFAIITAQDCIPFKRQIFLACYPILSGYFEK